MLLKSVNGGRNILRIWVGGVFASEAWGVLSREGSLPDPASIESHLALEPFVRDNASAACVDVDDGLQSANEVRGAARATGPCGLCIMQCVVGRRHAISMWGRARCARLMLLQL